MRLDWCRDTGRWNIWDIESGALLAKATQVDILAPSSLVTTDGGRHGYLVTGGKLTINADGSATIRRG